MLEHSAAPGINAVHEGDCIELLRSLPSGCAQLIIADPPYNLGPKFGVPAEWIRDPRWLRWCSEWMSECQRVLADDGNFFVYGIHHYLCLLQVRLYEMGMSYRRQIIWHYENGFTAYRRNLAAHYEPILWFSKKPDSYFQEIREPYKSTERLRHKISKNGKEWAPHPDGRLAGDVWSFPTLAGRRFRDERVNHPTQKPLALTDRIVSHFSPPGSLVVVPFAGSGTECLSALRNGRDYWGAEIRHDYVQLAERRLQAAMNGMLPGEPAAGAAAGPAAAGPAAAGPAAPRASSARPPEQRFDGRPAPRAAPPASRR